MEAMLVTGVLIAVVVGVSVKIWHIILGWLTPLFMLALLVILAGFVFGGTSVFSAGSQSEWATIMDMLLWEGVGERVVNAFMTFIRDTWALIVAY